MSLGKAVKTGSEKRKEKGEGTGRKRSKKKKYENIGEDWGLCEGTGRAVESFLYSGLEGVKVTKDENVKDYSAVKKRKKGKKEQALEIIAESNRKITDWTMRDMENINCVGRGVERQTPLMRDVGLLMIEWKPELIKNDQVLCESGGGQELSPPPLVNSVQELQNVSVGVSQKSGVLGQAECVLQMRKKSVKTKMIKRKVWTKLSNGLHAMRIAHCAR